jgi:hypothetical protein
MTAWTSEPPREDGHYHFKRDGGQPFVLRIIPAHDGVTREMFFVPPWTWKHASEDSSAMRSTHPIPRAEVLAAMHEVCEAAKGVMSGVALTPMLDLDAALRALEEARRG